MYTIMNFMALAQQEVTNKESSNAPLHPPFISNTLENKRLLLIYSSLICRKEIGTCH